MIQLDPSSVQPIGNKILGEIVEDKQIGLIHLPDNMEHSGDLADHSQMSAADRAKIKEDRFKYLDADVALTVRVLTKGKEVRWDVESGDILPIARTFIPDQAMVFEHKDTKYILFPATKDFVLGFIKGE